MNVQIPGISGGKIHCITWGNRPPPGSEPGSKPVTLRHFCWSILISEIRKKWDHFGFFLGETLYKGIHITTYGGMFVLKPGYEYVYLKIYIHNVTVGWTIYLTVAGPSSINRMNLFPEGLYSCTKSIFPNIMSMFEFDAYDLFWLNCTRTKLSNLDLPEIRRRFAWKVTKTHLEYIS